MIKGRGFLDCDLVFFVQSTLVFGFIIWRVPGELTMWTLVCFVLLAPVCNSAFELPIILKSWQSHWLNGCFLCDLKVQVFGGVCTSLVFYRNLFNIF